MNKRTLLRVLTVSLILYLLLTVVTPAYADTPVFIDIPVDVYEPVANPCGFDIDVHAFGTLKLTLFLDGDIATRWHLHWGQMNNTWEANGKNLVLQVSGPLHSEILPGTGYIDIALGTYAFATIPGYGHVYGSAGQIVTQYEEVNGEWIATEVKNVGTQWVENWDVGRQFIGE